MHATVPTYFSGASAVVPNQSKQHDIYQPIDTVQQYLEHFANYRKLNNQPMGGGGGLGVGGSSVGGMVGMRG